ncbi:protein kinase [Streptomyces sp. V4-01]|uniref:non-specific serine/threonine protein kinase n=1 Tax=Actinacidiphila polyblastidii TaxID=3110430 RepID=A0ABU7P7J9_9ACTN|nr:protein kinase [Streptomyces sp. V4-01]
MSEDEDRTEGRLLADRYRLGEVLGKGGMGTVWRAVDETLGRTVAVKELRFPGNVDEDEKRRLVTRTLREAKATARIRNTGAITVFDVVKEDDRPWIVMELVEGRSLSDAIREDGPLTPRRAAEVGLVLLDVLKAAHAEGILHRDVKPSNVLIADRPSDGDSGGGRVVLGDFGIAQIDGDPSVTSTGMLVGAPSYISPERARGQKPGPPADLWSLGALLYAAVEGRPPYDKGSAIATLTAVMTEPVGPMANAGPLAEAIRGLLVKDPEQRLDDAGARALLTTVVKAPERPVAPPAPTGDTRTTLMPVDPQPTPTDAPPATREAAAEQARVRDALRSVRKAGARPRPAPEPGTPETVRPSAPSSLSDVVPRRTLVIVVAALVLALLGTVIGVAIANSGGGGGDSKNPDKGGASPAATHGHTKSSGTQTPGGGSTTTAGAGTSTGTGKDGGDGKGKGSDDGKGSSDDSAGTPSGGPASAGTGGSAKLPAGWHMVTNTRFHFAVAMPPGWHWTGTTSGGSGAIYSADGGYPRVQVDFTSSPGTDAAANWEDIEPGVGRSSQDYHLIGIKAIQWRGYRTVADWDFTRTEKGGVHTHVKDRGFVVDDHHGYAIMVSLPASDWDSAGGQATRNGFYDTFRSVG